MTSLISVIVPIYKVEEYLDDCILSIVNQTYKNLEIILVDDGSPDKCPEICDNWKEKDSRIQVIHKINGGLSDARNAGLEIASGEYIAFVDSDDWIDENMYEIMMDKILSENADICACGILACYPTTNIPSKVKNIIGNSEDIFSLLYNDTLYPVSTWNKLYKKELWEKLRFPYGKICEDAFTTYLLIDRATKIVQIMDPLYNYRIRQNSIMTSSFNIKKMDEEEAWRYNYEFMKKHYPHIYKKSYDFYLQKVNMLIQTIPQELISTYKNEYNYLFNILKNNYWHILISSTLSIRYRIKFSLNFIQLIKQRNQIND